MTRPPERLDLFHFVPFRLNRLAAEVSSALSSEYQARYGLDIPEWRVLATLGLRHDACSAQYIAHCTRTHKSTISRAVSALMKREIVERVENERPPRIPPAPDPQGRSALRRTDPAPVAKRFSFQLSSPILLFYIQLYKKNDRLSPIVLFTFFSIFLNDATIDSHTAEVRIA